MSYLSPLAIMVIISGCLAYMALSCNKWAIENVIYMVMHNAIQK